MHLIKSKRKELSLRKNEKVDLILSLVLSLVRVLVPRLIGEGTAIMIRKKPIKLEEIKEGNDIVHRAQSQILVLRHHHHHHLSLRLDQEVVHIPEREEIIKEKEKIVSEIEIEVEAEAEAKNTEDQIRINHQKDQLQ